MNTTQVFEKRKIAVAIGIDLAKDHCDVVAYNLQVVKRSLKAQKRSRHFS